MINYDGTVSVVGQDGGKYEVDLSGMQLIESSSDVPNTCIRIKTDDGYVYTFGGNGYASLEYNALSWQSECCNDFANETFSVKTWREITAFHLTQIKAPNDRVLTISYRDIANKYHTNQANSLTEQGKASESNWDTSLLPQYQLCGQRTITTGYLAGLESTTGGNAAMFFQNDITPTYTLQKIALIESIRTDGCVISFAYSTRDKQPLPTTGTSKMFYARCGAKLDRISMTYNGRTESAWLTYDYALGNRMFLKRVKTTQSGTFGMDYNTPDQINAPNPLTCNIDHWGFWRGEQSDAALIPGMAYSGALPSFDYRLTTNHRDATGKQCDVSLLSKLTYPTGGCAKFEYEPHKYSSIIRINADANSYPSDYSLSASTSGTAGGARIRSIEYADASGSVQKKLLYTYGSLSREGKVMYMPFYRHLYVAKLPEDETYKVQGAAYSSEGFDHIQRGAHIRYPEVTEHYLDPSKGGVEQAHAYRKMEFQTGLNMTSALYSGNAYFQTLQVTGNDNIYTLFPSDYLEHLKRLPTFPADDIGIVYGKMSRETSYDAAGIVRRKTEYSYAYQNADNYQLSIYLPTYAARTMLDLYAHIGRTYFRTYLPTSVQTTDYYGADGSQQHRTWEVMKYDAAGYLLERAQPKTHTDSLITVYQRQELATTGGFQVMPVAERRYVGKAGGRTLLESRQMEYRPYPDATGTAQWHALAEEKLLDAADRVVDKVEYPRYDAYGNPLEAVTNGSEHTVFLWSRAGQCPRARIENASYQEVSTALGKDPGSLSATGNDEAALDNLRTLLPAARVYSYWSTYGNKPTIIREANGRDTRYAYENGERLSRVFRYDENGTLQMLQANDYHFVNP